MKGQIAYEFLFVFFLLALTFTVWVMFSSEMQSDMLDLERSDIAADLVYRIQEEAFTAASIEGSFERSFDLPFTIKGANYTFEAFNSNNRTYGMFISSGVSREFILPPSEGRLAGGKNTIISEEGYVKFSPP